MFDKNFKSLFFVSGLTLVMKIISVGAEFLLQILLARLLGISEYGMYIYVLTWVSVLAMISTLGLDTTAIRLVATYKNNQQWALLKGLLIRSIQIISLSSVIVAVLLAIYAFVFVFPNESEMNKLFLYSAMLIPLIALNRLKQSVLRGMKYVIRYEVSDNILRPVFYALIVAGIYVSKLWAFDAITAILIYVLLTIMILAVGGHWLLKLKPTEWKTAESKFMTKDWLLVSLPLLMVSGMQLVLNQTDIIMIGMFINTDSAGIYSAAARISTLVTFGLLAVNAILAPMVAELYSSNQMEQLQKVLTYTVRIAFAFTVSIGIGVVIFGELILKMFGTDFMDAYIPLLILLVGQVINALCGSVGVILTMVKKQMAAAKIVTLCALINIVLNIQLIPTFGIQGAAISTSISVALLNIWMLIYIRRKLKINPTIF